MDREIILPGAQDGEDDDVRRSMLEDVDEEEAREEDERLAEEAMDVVYPWEEEEAEEAPRESSNPAV